MRPSNNSDICCWVALLPGSAANSDHGDGKNGDSSDGRGERRGRATTSDGDGDGK